MSRRMEQGQVLKGLEYLGEELALQLMKVLFGQWFIFSKTHI